MKQSELMAEVDGVIDERLSRSEPAPMTWIVQEIMNRHNRISGYDADFYVLCGYEHVRDTTREVLRRRKKGETDLDRQIAIPGFPLLQRSYSIQRGDEQLAVLLEQMTDEEIDVKADELARMGEGCIAHGAELREWKRRRAEAKATRAV
jgi:hypothetical protein